MRGAKLFICDRFWQAPRKFYERLRAAHSVFKVDLQLGGYQRQVREAIVGCDALIAIIGPNWLDEQGRLELATAFERSIPVIPVLLEETPLPEKSQLSENIQKLSSQMAVRIRSSSFDTDVEMLENFITMLLSKRSLEGRPFDVFLCHNSQDKQFVKEIAEQLMTRGIRPWLDEWEQKPGLSVTKALEDAIDNIRTAAIFVGESGFGPWQNLEKDAFLHAFVERQCPIIPVLLKTCQITPKLPTFLRGFIWVDFRKSVPDPMAQLVWGISGERPMPK